MQSCRLSQIFNSFVDEKMQGSEFLSEDNVDEGEEDNFDVEPPRSVFQIFQIHLQTLQHLFHGVGIAVVDGCHRRDARTNLVETFVSRIVLHNLVDIELSFRTWPNKRHVTNQHVPELWQFIKVMVAQEFAGLG